VSVRERGRGEGGKERGGEGERKRGAAYHISQYSQACIRGRDRARAHVYLGERARARVFLERRERENARARVYLVVKFPHFEFKLLAFHDREYP
jgi:hypothetical protein